jgi:hypothetical protein
MLTDKQKALVYDLMDAQEAYLAAERRITVAQNEAKNLKLHYLKAVSQKTGIPQDRLVMENHVCITKMLHHVYDTSQTQNHFHQKCVFCGCPRDEIE